MSVRMTAEEYRKESKEKEKSKYRNVPVTIDGIRFASKKEAKYYRHLKSLEKDGKVYEIELQRRYDLKINGCLICTYVADFVYHDAIAKRNRCVDVKGVETREFKIKKKLMMAIHGIEVECVK